MRTSQSLSLSLLVIGLAQALPTHSSHSTIQSAESTIQNHGLATTLQKEAHEGVREAQQPLGLGRERSSAQTLPSGLLLPKKSLNKRLRPHPAVAKYFQVSSSEDEPSEQKETTVQPPSQASPRHTGSPTAKKSAAKGLTPYPAVAKYFQDSSSEEELLKRKNTGQRRASSQSSQGHTKSSSSPTQSLDRGQVGKFEQNVAPILQNTHHSEHRVALAQVSSDSHSARPTASAERGESQSAASSGHSLNWYGTNSHSSGSHWPAGSVSGSAQERGKEVRATPSSSQSGASPHNNLHSISSDKSMSSPPPQQADDAGTPSSSPGPYPNKWFTNRPREFKHFLQRKRRIHYNRQRRALASGKSKQPQPHDLPVMRQTFWPREEDWPHLSSDVRQKWKNAVRAAEELEAGDKAKALEEPRARRVKGPPREAAKTDDPKVLRIREQWRIRQARARAKKTKMQLEQMAQTSAQGLPIIRPERGRG